MKNFSDLEAKKLVKKIWKVHNEIFSLPAKRYVFCLVDATLCGLAAMPYDFLQEVNGKKICVIRDFEKFNNFNFKFGDRLIVVYCNKNINIENDFIFTKKRQENNLPEHNSIIANVNFFNHIEFALLYRNCMLGYKNQNIFPEITKQFAFEHLVRDSYEK